MILFSVIQRVNLSIFAINITTQDWMRIESLNYFHLLSQAVRVFQSDHLT